jgi:polar amino acid transport system substrate-binding protein
VRRLDAVLKEWIPADKRRNAPEEDEKTLEAAALPKIPLPKIEGIDTAVGVARVGGSRNSYLNLLEMFCRDVEAGNALIEKAPEEATLRSFTTQVHALKSALGNIGASNLSQVAAQLEQAGREADLSAIRQNLTLFRERLDVLRGRIGEFLASSRNKDEKPGDPEIMDTLACLRKALEAKDFGAIDTALSRAQSQSPTGAMGEAVSEIADCILTAEFKKATDALNVLLG